MNKLLFYLILILLFTQCKSNIKNENATVFHEEGIKLPSNVQDSNQTKPTIESGNNLYGFWVGYFLKDGGNDEFDEKDVYVDEGFNWSRENKINISIDKIDDSLVTGHSVVAGNNRPFKGTIKNENGIFHFVVKEPGDNKYDGIFSFKINDTLLEGTWQAYKTIDISKRKYQLKKRIFKYDPNIMLAKNRQFVNWEKSKVHGVHDEGDEYVSKEFSSATDLIFEINASNKLLTKDEVQNLKKGDLLIIRNTIYARHGYSFKNRPLRVFFDSQEWYIPVYADIKSEFTEIEKKNIELLLRYEKNAKEYYDYFGRG